MASVAASQYPRRRIDAFLVINSVTITLGILLVAARFYVRIVILKKLWWDDYLISLALVSI